MYIFVDPSQEGKITLQLFKSDKNTRPTYAKASVGKPSKSVGFSQADELLEIIDDFLRDHKTKPQQLDGIIVVNDAPRFTTLRTVLTILNTMAWMLDIPIMEKKIPIRSHPDQSRGKTFKFKPLTPHYSAPPTITLPKKKKG